MSVDMDYEHEGAYNCRDVAERYAELICKNIRRLRKARKLTQEQFAELADISVRGLSKIENQEGDPRHSSIIKCARALDVHPIYFYLEQYSNALPFNFEYPEKVLNAAIIKRKKTQEDTGGAPPQYLYQMVLHSDWDSVNGVREHYGICVYETKGGRRRRIGVIEDISSSHKVVSEIVHKINLYKLHQIHLLDYLEDIL